VSEFGFPKGSGYIVDFTTNWEGAVDLTEMSCISVIAELIPDVKPRLMGNES